MKLHTLWQTPVLALAMMLTCVGAWAHEGHDDLPSASADPGQTQPRFVAESDAFELVGVLHDRRLALYLDHAPDNRPVTDGTLALVLDGQAIPVQPHGEGEFEALLEAPLPNEQVPVQATVSTGGVSEVLTTTLDMHVGSPVGDDPGGVLSHAPVALGAIAALALAWLLWALRRRTRTAGGTA